jgi:mono/diheme cytochrome c family protein
MDLFGYSIIRLCARFVRSREWLDPGGAMRVAVVVLGGSPLAARTPEFIMVTTGEDLRRAQSPRGWAPVVHDSRRSRRLIGAVLCAIGLGLVSAPGCGPSGRLAPRPAARPASAVSTAKASPQAGRAASATVAKELSGPQLYGYYCAACHGENGGGDGPAARFLYPKPRNFREGQFRLVTTTNQVPSDEDLMRVVERGMPGSAMFAFGHLPESERWELVAEGRKWVRQGQEDRLRRDAAEVGEQVNPADLADILKRKTQPGPRLKMPVDLLGAGPESVARGLAQYRKICASCHGETGRGDGVQEQKDESGMPIRPRDFTRGIFKGGREPEQLYARIMLGAPGTPMPSSSAVLKPVEVGDLINFVLSLSDPSTPGRVEHRRRRLFAWRIATPFSEEIPETVWRRIEPTPVVVSPLWWRDHDDPDLQVQAVHDGQTLAIRLSWCDVTHNAEAVRPQDFPDMGAVQWYRGRREPFLGMGAADSPVEVWLWNAAAQADLGRYADVDTTYPGIAVDQYPFERPGELPRAHPTDRQPQDFLSAWAAGNLRSDPTHVSAGSNLLAQGFGTLTMRPRASQVVSARGRWDAGRWEVVLRRPLKVAPDEGRALASGDRVSIALALWDGAACDRNGQKLVSIWHDLDLE